MPTYFRVSPKFWRDPQVRSWGDDARLLALYLLTCPSRTTEGLFAMPFLYAAADLKWDPSRLAEARKVLEDAEFLKVDEDAEVVLITRALAYQAPESPNHVRAVLNHLADLPPTSLLDEFYGLAVTHSPRLAEGLRDEYPVRWGSQPRLPVDDAHPEGPDQGYAAALAAPPKPKPDLDLLPDDAGFQTFWEAMPKRNGKRGSKKKAQQKWARMTSTQRAQALVAAPNYARHCELADEYAADVVTWLNQDRWEEFQEEPNPRDYVQGKRRTQADHHSARDGKAVL